MKDEYTGQDFAEAFKNPYAGKFIKNGKYTVVIEHDGYNEAVEVDIKTGKKTKLQGIVEK